MNKVILMGRLTRDPDVRWTQGPEQKCTARYTLAVDRGKDNADFVSCIAWEKQAEFVDKYLQKGTKILIEGSIRTGSYTNRDGQKVYTTDVVVSHHEFAERKGEPVSQPEQASDGFMNIPDGVDDEGLPFN